MGPPPRTTYNHSLRPNILPRTLQIPRLPQHSPIALRCSSRLHLPPLRHQRLRNSTHLPQSPHHHPSLPRRRNILPSLSIRLCLPRTHRLYHLHPRKELQIAPRHVPPHHALPAQVPFVQIPRRVSCDFGSSSFHSARWFWKSAFETTS